MIVSNEWVNIPAAYLLIAYLCSIVIFTELHPHKSSYARRFAGYAAVLIVFGAALFPNPNAYGLRFFVSMFSIWGGMLLFFKFFLNISWRNAGYITVRAFFIGDFAASLIWQLVFYLMSRMGTTDKVFMTLTVMIPGYAVWFAMVYLVERQFREVVSDMIVQKKDFLLMLSIGVFMYFLANISYVVEDSPFNAPVLSQTYALRTLAEFGAVAILLAFHYRIADLRDRLRMQAMEDAWQAQADHLRTYEASVALVNQKYHDLKHQLRLLRESVSAGDRLKYVGEMERELETYEAQNKTGNATLDTILTAKHMECLHAEICLTCVADGAALGGMHPLDISALFGNLLDNAIECEKRIPETEKRLIHISVSRRKSYTLICVRNICENPVQFVNGLPLSTKGDDRYHGVGTASVRNITEKYHGSLLMRCREGWFEVSILMPGEYVMRKE